MIKLIKKLFGKKEKLPEPDYGPLAEVVPYRKRWKKVNANLEVPVKDPDPIPELILEDKPKKKWGKPRRQA